MTPRETKILFKDAIDPQAVFRLASVLKAAWSQFPEDQFVAAGTRGLKKLELKDRVRHLMGTHKNGVLD